MLQVYGSGMCPDWESYFTEQGIAVEKPREAGAACRVDGKGC
ncbi:hypothetical protein [Butyrivibrio sp. VCD2006]|nr:hypothetical protein [Butyrivibrio sp. VCD2006]